MKFHWFAMLAALPALTAASARDEAKPKPSVPQATVVSAGEIRAAVARNNTGAIADVVLNVESIGSRYNVGVAVVRRTPTNGRAPVDALVHTDVMEVYHIIEGNGVLITGGIIQSPKPLTDSAIVREIGPSLAGTSISGGTRHQVGPGDIVVVPPHTPHGFVEIGSKRIVYTIIRIDPKRVLALTTPQP